MKIGCVGMTTIDTLLFTDVLPQSHEGLSRVQSARTCIGGKGMVTALSAFMLGCDVSLLTMVGDREEVTSLLPADFSGKYFLETLQSNNRTWIPVSNDQSTVTFIYSSPLRDFDRAEVFSTVGEFVGSIEVLYISTEHTFLIKEAALAASRLSVPLVSNLNTPLICDLEDLAGAMPKLLVDVSHTIIMNEAESEQALAKLNLRGWTEVTSPCLQEIIITQASRGGVFAVRPFTKWVRYEAQPVKETVCTVGAGDTFNGAYLKSRFIEKSSILGSCENAARAAGMKVCLPSSSLCIEGMASGNEITK